MSIYSVMLPLWSFRWKKKWPTEDRLQGSWQLRGQIHGLISSDSFSHPSPSSPLALSSFFHFFLTFPFPLAQLCRCCFSVNFPHSAFPFIWTLRSELTFQLAFIAQPSWQDLFRQHPAFHSDISSRSQLEVCCIFTIELLHSLPPTHPQCLGPCTKTESLLKTKGLWVTELEKLRFLWKKGWILSNEQLYWNLQKIKWLAELLILKKAEHKLKSSKWII